jgi:hypothetical protein
MRQLCVLDPNATLDGITHQQDRQLRKRSNPLLSESEQWFVIWDGLFPGHPRPSSAYLDSSLSEDLCQYREYVRRNGHEVLAQELRSRGILLSVQQQQDARDHAENDEVQDAAIREAMLLSLDMLFDDWLSTRGNSGQPSTSHRREESLTSSAQKRQRTSSPSRPTTPSSAFVDGSTGLLDCPSAVYPQQGEAMHLRTTAVNHELHIQGPPVLTETILPDQLLNESCLMATKFPDFDDIFLNFMETGDLLQSNGPFNVDMYIAGLFTEDDTVAVAQELRPLS